MQCRNSTSLAAKKMVVSACMSVKGSFHHPGFNLPHATASHPHVVPVQPDRAISTTDETAKRAGEGKRRDKVSSWKSVAVVDEGCIMFWVF